MNSNGDADGGTGGTVEWAVVGSDIGPLLLAATAAGLVSVVFHMRPRGAGQGGRAAAGPARC